MLVVDNHKLRICNAQRNYVEKILKIFFDISNKPLPRLLKSLRELAIVITASHAEAQRCASYVFLKGLVPAAGLEPASPR